MIPLALSLFLAAAPATPPAPDAADDLVDVSVTAPGVRIEVRYATPDNFLHEAVYPCARCLLRRPAAEALARAQRALAAKGLGLRVWDCYRPPSVQQRMWALVPDARFVANPAKGSIHNRGGAVDLTLVDAAGKPLPMPTPFDEFTPRAAADAPAAPEAARNRALLRQAMEEAGFAGIRSEWWHFDLAGSRGWPVLDAPLCPPDAAARAEPPARATP
jgi:D-alanyl-D-alanine dipeptidase